MFFKKEIELSMHIHPNHTISNPRLRGTPADRNLAKQRLIIDSGRSVCHTTEEKDLFI
jgi:hypothetical protein